MNWTFINMRNLKLIFVILFFFANSCASYIPVNPAPENVESMIKKGDEIKIKTKDNEEIKLEVDYLTEEAIIGKKKTVQFSDISKLEKMTTSTTKKIFGGIIAAVLIGLLVTLDAALHSNDDDHHYDDDHHSITGYFVESSLDIIFYGCYPDFHPGDLFYRDNVKYADSYKRDLVNCESECTISQNCIDNLSTFRCERESQLEYKSCVKECMVNKQYLIAMHVEDGYYSDGSYYKNCDKDSSKYENTHRFKDSYSKNQWQMVRDDCMESTYQVFSKQNKRLKDFYNRCMQDELKGYGLNKLGTD